MFNRFNRKKPTWRESDKSESKKGKKGSKAHRDWILPINEDADILLGDDIPAIEEHLRGLLQRAMPAGDHCTADV